MSKGLWVSSPIGVGGAAVVGDWLWNIIERVRRLLRNRSMLPLTDGSRLKASEGGAKGIGRKRIKNQ